MTKPTLRQALERLVEGGDYATHAIGRPLRPATASLGAMIALLADTSSGVPRDGWGRRPKHGRTLVMTKRRHGGEQDLAEALIALGAESQIEDGAVRAWFDDVDVQFQYDGQMGGFAIIATRFATREAQARLKAKAYARGGRRDVTLRLPGETARERWSAKITILDGEEGLARIRSAFDIMVEAMRASDTIMGMAEEWEVSVNVETQRTLARIEETPVMDWNQGGDGGAAIAAHDHLEHLLALHRPVQKAGRSHHLFEATVRREGSATLAASNRLRVDAKVAQLAEMVAGLGL